MSAFSFEGQPRHSGSAKGKSASNEVNTRAHLKLVPGIRGWSAWRSFAGGSTIANARTCHNLGVISERGIGVPSTLTPRSPSMSAPAMKVTPAPA